MKYDIESLKRKMLVKYPFFGSVIANVDYKEDIVISTAGTDGKTIYYNPEYLERLSIEEQIFIFAHEVCHIAFNHILRSEGKDPEIWNIATDAVINQFLKKDGLKLASGGVDIEEAINYDVEQLYEKLLQQKQQSGQDQQSSQGNNQNQQSNGQNQGQTQSSSSRDSQNQQSTEGSSDLDTQQKEEKNEEDVGHDTHSLWKEAVKKHKEEQSKSSNQKESLLDKLFNKEKKEKKKSEIEKKQEELETIGEKNAFNKNSEDKRKQLEELKQEIAKQASQAGKTTNRDIRIVENIGNAKPLIDWRYILREAIKYEVDWSYKNANIENGIVIANLEEQPIPETEILLDTSGSINEIILKNFLRECKNILQHSKIKVGCFDEEFYGFCEIRTEEDIENMKFVGGGGTNFDVAVSAFSRRVENKIIFTDGEAPMPDMVIDVIWIVFGEKKINPKGGRVINITEEQLDRLYSYEIVDEIKGIIR